MAEVFMEFQAPIIGSDGMVYRARACGRQVPGDTAGWEGWIEFFPVDGGPPLRSRRETTQPNRADTEYWSTGLTPVYLEGALERTLKPLIEPPAAPRSVAVLDPFSVYAKGEALLTSQLSALSSWHLVNIIRAFDLSAEDLEMLETRPAAELTEIIVRSVRRRAA